MDWLLLCFLVTVTLLFVMLMARTKKQQKHTRNKVTEPASVLIVVGSGGHTSEILKLVKVMGYHYSPRYYVIADTDTISEHKVREVETERENSGRNCEEDQFREHLVDIHNEAAKLVPHHFNIPDHHGEDISVTALKSYSSIQATRQSKDNGLIYSFRVLSPAEINIKHTFL